MAKTIESYCIEHSTRPSALTVELAEETRKSVPGSNMLIGELEASILAFLIHSIKAKRILELGTYTGYSSLCMAEQLPEGGEIITVDIDKSTVAIAQKYWARSPHGKKIKSVLQSAKEYLTTLTGEFDLVFIDADKGNYPHYLEWAREHLSANGVIVVDNTLWSGRVIQDNPDAHTQKIMETARIASSWPGFVTTLLPVRDGMLLVKRSAN